jgi:polar amino acid transport system substrate-binding protein
MAALLSLSFGAVQAADDLMAIRRAGVLKVGVKQHAPPFSQASEGQLVGFDVAIAQTVASYLEVELELVPLVSADRIPFLKEGKVDMVVATMTATRRREKEVDFSISYFEDGQSLLCLANSEIQSYQDLKEKTVAAVAGTTSLRNFPLIQPLAKTVDYPTANDAVAALLAGEVDAVTSDMLMLMGLKLGHEAGKKLEIRGGKFTTEPYGVAMRQNQSNLREIVNEALMAMWRSGTWKTLYDKWFGGDSDYAHENAFSMRVIN